MAVKKDDATNPPRENLPKGQQNGQDRTRKVPERWQKTERASRAWRDAESRTDGTK